MGVCWNDGCLNTAKHKCSGCKTAWYCGEKCQRASWKHHKMECAMNRIFHDAEEETRRKEAENPPPRPSRTRCTGCNVKFTEDYDADGDCPDCGYMACESCSCHNSRGTCYCVGSNFGNLYCEMVPKWYHGHRGGSYRSDYHPSSDYQEINPLDNPELFEEKPRECKNCKKTALCIRREHLR